MRAAHTMMLARQTYAPACLQVGWGGAYNVAALDGLGFPERARRMLAVLTMKRGPGGGMRRDDGHWQHTTGHLCVSGDRTAG